jgi:hypothetical protein
MELKLKMINQKTYKDVTEKAKKLGQDSLKV